MNNYLHEGYEIEREDGTRETYWEWSLDQVRILESGRKKYSILHRIYEIDNEFHKYTYDCINGIFRDHNESADEITEIETESGIAGYLWRLATEADEDSVRAYKFMAIDIFGNFEKWRAMAFCHILIEHECDVDYLKEVTK